MSRAHTAPFPSPAEAIAGRFRPDARAPGQAETGPARAADANGGPAAALAAEPAPALTAPALRLRVLSGPQAGAGERLRGPHCVISNGLDGDLVLHLPGAPQRALLSIQPGSEGLQALLTPLEGRFRLYGRELTLGKSQPWPQDQELTMGDLRLGWSQDEGLPPLPRPAPAEHAPAAVTSSMATGPGGLAPAQRRRRPMLWLLLPALLLLSGLLFLLPLEELGWPVRSPSPGPMAGERQGHATPRVARTASAPASLAPPASTEQKLRAWLQGRGWSTLRVTGREPQLKLSGLLDDASQLRQLQHDVRQAGFAPQFEVHLRPAQRQAAEQLLAGYQMQARMHWPADGQLELQLTWQDLPRARRLALSLLEEVPGLQQVRVYAAPAAQAQVRAERLSQGLRINEEWVLPLEAVFQGRNQIQMVQVEPRRMLVLANGRHIFEGGQLDSQRRIEHISLDSLWLQDEGLRKRVLLP